MISPVYLAKLIEDYQTRQAEHARVTQLDVRRDDATVSRAA